MHSFHRAGFVNELSHVILTLLEEVDRFPNITVKTSNQSAILLVSV